jgi:hypothetical protein
VRSEAREQPRNFIIGNCLDRGWLGSWAGLFRWMAQAFDRRAGGLSTILRQRALLKR